METLLEQQRRYHEERERLVDALVQERLGEKKTHKDAINSEHRQRAMLERWDIVHLMIVSPWFGEMFK